MIAGPPQPQPFGQCARSKPGIRRRPGHDEARQVGCWPGRQVAAVAIPPDRYRTILRHQLGFGVSLKMFKPLFNCKGFGLVAGAR